uniref:NADP-dependent oxidoreductase domain-containing protein n=1 Tax=Clastoptera arizonana TaxID=38151 RepID=A0A1B6CEA4_9HEMI
MSPNVPFVTFNNGLKFPIFGLGTWKSKPGEVTQAVKDAIDVGYRHIDTAFVYGNEKEVGLGIKAKIDDKTVKREDLYITTKLWNTFHQPDLVMPALQDSLSNLGLSYVDLYLIHWPMGYKEGGALFPEENGKTLYSTSNYLDTYKELEKAVDLGLVKSIGVSNFNSKQLDEIFKIARIKPVTNQVECHPYLNQRKLQTYHKTKGLILTAYSPLGSPDRPWAKPTDLPMLDKPELKALAEKYNKTPAQIVIRYQIERGNIVIPKSVTKSRIISNIDVFNFSLKPEDIKTLDSFDCNERFLLLEHVKDHKDYPFNIEF